VRQAATLQDNKEDQSFMDNRRRTSRMCGSSAAGRARWRAAGRARLQRRLRRRGSTAAAGSPAPPPTPPHRPPPPARAVFAYLATQYTGNLPMHNRLGLKAHACMYGMAGSRLGPAISSTLTAVSTCRCMDSASGAVGQLDTAVVARLRPPTSNSAAGAPAPRA
jgi:hypothetical protein